MNAVDTDLFAMVEEKEPRTGCFEILEIRPEIPSAAVAVDGFTNKDVKRTPPKGFVSLIGALWSPVMIIVDLSYTPNFFISSMYSEIISKLFFKEITTCVRSSSEAGSQFSLYNTSWHPEM